MNKNKKLGFTLAEVLIVIGIIGVVAALTLPNLNHATGDKEKVTKVKKIYSALTEAFDRAQVIYGNADEWFNDLKNSEGVVDSNAATASERAAKRITEFMKVSKDCGFNEGCFSSAPYLDISGNINNDNFLETLQDTYMVMLSDGTSVSFGVPFNQQEIRFRVDIDGPNKGKNQEGNDIFDFLSVTLDGNYGLPANQLMPFPFEMSWYGDAGYATAWVIKNGNLDYLKCYDQLNWETKTSCE